MGFAWHKLIPRPIEETLQCLDYCCCDTACIAAVCPAEQFGSVYDQDGNVICLEGHQPSIAPNACCEDDIPYLRCTWVLVDGVWQSSCEPSTITVSCPCLGIYPIIDDPNDPPRSQPSGPLTMRINLPSPSGSPYPCRRVNDETYNAKTGCDPNEITDEFPRRYYNTPSQAAGLTSFGYTSLCTRINTYTVPDRTMIFSGRNKYNYTGFLAPDSSSQGCFIPSVIDNPGASGLSQMEGSLSRVFPLPDSVLANNLWGAVDATASPTAGDDPTCYPSVCYGSGCYAVQENDGTGHYLSGLTTGMGYFSFSCFNPHAQVNLGSSPIGLPTCSLYSMVWAVYDATWRSYGFGSEQDNVDFYGTTFTPLRNQLNTLLNTDPSGMVGGVSNVAIQLEAFSDRIQSFVNEISGFPLSYRVFEEPQVFLWDRTAYINATPTNKWKHLYIAGSANILMDTGCTGTNGWKGFRAVLDEVTHDRVHGSTHSAMIVGFMGCNNNLNSQQLIVPVDLGCALIAGGDGAVDGFCQLCATSDSPYNMDYTEDCVPYPMGGGGLQSYPDRYATFCTCCT